MTSDPTCPLLVSEQPTLHSAAAVLLGAPTAVSNTYLHAQAGVSNGALVNVETGPLMEHHNTLAQTPLG